MARRAVGSADFPDDSEHVVDAEVAAYVMRRAPRYGRFITLGILVGLVVAVILTAASGAAGGPASAGVGGVLRVFGVTALVCVAIGLLISAVLAMILDRMGARRRTQHVIVDHTTTLVDDLSTPVGDEPPAWARDLEEERGER
jgi:hypothetical protein